MSLSNKATWFQRLAVHVPQSIAALVFTLMQAGSCTCMITGTYDTKCRVAMKAAETTAGGSPICNLVAQINKLSKTMKVDFGVVKEFGEGGGMSYDEFQKKCAPWLLPRSPRVAGARAG